MRITKYPSDLTDDQWERIRRLLPKRRRGKAGRPREVDRRDLIDAILCLLRTGCQWRMLPKDFPPWGTVASQFYRWRTSGVWERLHQALYAQTREFENKGPKPTAGIIDSQSVKTTEQGGPRGYDAGKKVNGRKRHVVVDTLGLLIAVVVTPANVQDYDAAPLVLAAAKRRFRSLQLIWADGIYGYCQLVDRVWLMFTLVLEIVKRPMGAKFVALPRRWVVERTLAWLSRSRRLSKDYERSIAVSETMVQLGMIHVMLRRLTVA